MLFVKNVFWVFIFYIFSLSLNLDDSSILLIQFKGKSLLADEIIDEDSEPMWETDSDYPYVPKEEIYNTSQFINNWFYNGMYAFHMIGSKQIESYINMYNSKLSIEKCNLNRIYSKTTLNQKGYYKPSTSDTFTEKNTKIGNDFFYFVGDLRYKTTIQIGEKKGEGLNFYYNKDNNNDDTVLCGNIGLNINSDLDETNIITQLKKKKYINKYIWTLKYQTEDDGIIIFGTEPHFYSSDSFYMSQFCQIKAIPNQSKDTMWSFKMDEISTYDENKKKILLTNKKVDFLIDRGLIIGTDEYKNKIDELVFNNLINEKICFREVNTFIDNENGNKDDYYIYYCNLNYFMGDKNYPSKEYYKTFPSLNFFIKDSNMTFSLNKEDLFHVIFSRVYFLVVFKKSENENNIWKLGEPFFSHFQFTFNQEQKTVGFYNTKLEKIDNDEYMKNNNNNNNNNNNKKNSLYLVILIVIVVILIVALAGMSYYLGKKIKENRKKRANELDDEEYEYSAQKNNTNTNKEEIVIN